MVLTGKVNRKNTEGIISHGRSVSGESADVPQTSAVRLDDAYLTEIKTDIESRFDKRERLEYKFSTLTQGGMMVYLHNKNKVPSNVFLLNEVGQEIDYGMHKITEDGLQGEINKDSIAIPLGDHAPLSGEWKLILLF